MISSTSRPIRRVVSVSGTAMTVNCARRRAEPEPPAVDGGAGRRLEREAVQNRLEHFATGHDHSFGPPRAAGLVVRDPQRASGVPLDQIDRAAQDEAPIEQ